MNGKGRPDFITGTSTLHIVAAEALGVNQELASQLSQVQVLKLFNSR